MSTRKLSSAQLSVELELGKKEPNGSQELPAHMGSLQPNGHCQVNQGIKEIKKIYKYKWVPPSTFTHLQPNPPTVSKLPKCKRTRFSNKYNTYISAITSIIPHLYWVNQHLCRNQSKIKHTVHNHLSTFQQKAPILLYYA